MSRILSPAALGLFLLTSLVLSTRSGESALAAASVRPGMYVTVSGTDGYALKLRSSPSPLADVEQHLPSRTVARVLDGPKSDGRGWDWYRITGFDRAGTIGWSVGYFLAPALNPALNIPRQSPRPPFRVLARITAFNGAEFGNPWGGKTRLGTMVRGGVVATDPAFIPLGSELTIDGLQGVFVAEDTGSGVFGYHVDIWMPTYEAAWNFGSRWAYITVLGRPYER